jgi:hypothetical protein
MIEKSFGWSLKLIMEMAAMMSEEHTREQKHRI